MIIGKAYIFVSRAILVKKGKVGNLFRVKFLPNGLINRRNLPHIGYKLVIGLLILGGIILLKLKLPQILINIPKKPLKINHNPHLIKPQQLPHNL